jgi:hypothetical protein
MTLDGTARLSAIVDARGLDAVVVMLDEAVSPKEHSALAEACQQRRPPGIRGCSVQRKSSPAQSACHNPRVSTGGKKPHG